ncbi:oxidoreductase [Bacillus pinisoli]|uniref:oxidoreductase n=1 Tax=Bacillus pinisoli TaxID=2901866 RepID=UPI001FF20BFB|nr:oxidoreductase [Bacillus pinisoli]
MDKANKTAALIGASGLVGTHLLEVLLQSNEYSEVKVLVRNKLNITHKKLTQIQVDFNQLLSVQEHLCVDDVFCCLGTTIKKAKTKDAFRTVDYEYPVKLAIMAKECEVNHFLVITALGSNSHSSFFYNRVKGELEERLKELNLSSLYIFRPSLLLGKREEFRLGEKLATYLTPLFTMFLSGSRKKYRPIQAEDVAKAMYLAAQNSGLGTHVIESDQIHTMSKQ